MNIEIQLNVKWPCSKQLSYTMYNENQCMVDILMSLLVKYAVVNEMWLLSNWYAEKNDDDDEYWFSDRK